MACSRYNTTAAASIITASNAPHTSTTRGASGDLGTNSRSTSPTYAPQDRHASGDVMEVVSEHVPSLS
jgi:hypothetical protein